MRHLGHGPGPDQARQHGVVGAERLFRAVAEGQQGPDRSPWHQHGRFGREPAAEGEDERAERPHRPHAPQDRYPRRLDVEARPHEVFELRQLGIAAGEHSERVAVGEEDAPGEHQVDDQRHDHGRPRHPNPARPEQASRAPGQQHEGRDSDLRGAGLDQHGRGSGDREEEQPARLLAALEAEEGAPGQDEEQHLERFGLHRRREVQRQPRGKESEDPGEPPRGESARGEADPPPGPRPRTAQATRAVRAIPRARPRAGPARRAPGRAAARPPRTRGRRRPRRSAGRGAAPAAWPGSARSSGCRPGAIPSSRRPGSGAGARSSPRASRPPRGRAGARASGARQLPGAAGS